MADVVAKCWNDPEYKSQLAKYPKTVLKDAGIEGINEDITIKVVQNSDLLKYIVLPPASKGEDYVEKSAAFLTSKLPLPAGLQLAFVQNSDNLAHIVLPVEPPGYQGKLDASHAQVLAAAGYEAINLYTTANAVAEANAAAVQNVAAATEGAALAVALVVCGVVI